jgi:hypothetical protein
MKEAAKSVRKRRRREGEREQEAERAGVMRMRGCVRRVA